MPDAELPGEGQVLQAPPQVEEWLPISTVPAPRVTFLGIQGSGKTFLVKEKIIPMFSPFYLVIDPNGEYEGFNRYIPKYGDNPELYKQEIELLIRKVIIPSCDTLEDQKARGKRKVRALRLLVIEEADLLAPSQKLINPMVRRLVVVSRHLDLCIAFIARRPTDLNAYIMDTSDFLITFKQTGANAKKILRNICEGADTAIGEIDFKKHEFLFFNRDREYTTPSVDELCEALASEMGVHLA
jgi:hypothetical protein